MRKLSLSLILTGIFSTPASAQGLNLNWWISVPNRLWEDVKADTGFKVDSTIPGIGFDHADGVKVAGNITPFFHAGSYFYLAGGLAGKVGSGANSAKRVVMLGSGLRLNGITRPLVKKGLEQIPWVKNNTPLIDGLADAISVNYMPAHDFDHTTKNKVVINRHLVFLGFELTFGGSPSGSDVGAQSTQNWFLR